MKTNQAEYRYPCAFVPVITASVKMVLDAHAIHPKIRLSHMQNREDPYYPYACVCVCVCVTNLLRERTVQEAIAETHSIGRITIAVSRHPTVFHSIQVSHCTQVPGGIARFTRLPVGPGRRLIKADPVPSTVYGVTLQVQPVSATRFDGREQDGYL